MKTKCHCGKIIIGSGVGTAGPPSPADNNQYLHTVWNCVPAPSMPDNTFWSSAEDALIDVVTSPQKVDVRKVWTEIESMPSVIERGISITMEAAVYLSAEERIKLLTLELEEAYKRLAKCNTIHDPDCDYMGCCGGGLEKSRGSV